MTTLPKVDLRQSTSTLICMCTSKGRTAGKVEWPACPTKAEYAQKQEQWLRYWQLCQGTHPCSSVAQSAEWHKQ